MSHIVAIRTEVRDPAAIRAACGRLHLPEPAFGEVRLFSNSAILRPFHHIPHAIQCKSGKLPLLYVPENADLFSTFPRI